MGQTDSLNFFTQMSRSDSILLLKECITENAKLFVVEENHVQAHACRISAITSSSKFYIDSDKKKINFDQKYSFCLKKADRVYFFKSSLKQDQGGIFLMDDILLFELQRRKHTRFDLPAEWSQSCIINYGLKQVPKIKANIINISWSGIRLELFSNLQDFKLKQKIQFAIRIHRRAEFVISGEIINIRKNKLSGFFLGIEFAKTSPLLESKIQNICDDLLRYFVLKQKNIV
jgi:c-di-GMP-binding flagellar brake protein YcgR